MKHTPTTPLSPEQEEVIVVASAFAALGSEARLGIVRRLVRAGPEGLAIGDLGAAVGVTGSVLTHHLKQLVAAGLVYQKRDGRRILCFVEHEMITDLSDYLIAECCADAGGHQHGGPHG